MATYLLGTPTNQTSEPTIRVVTADGIVDVRKGDLVKIRPITDTLEWWIGGGGKHTVDLPARTTFVAVDRTSGDTIAWRAYLITDDRITYDVDQSPLPIPESTSASAPPGAGTAVVHVESFITDDVLFGFGYKSAGCQVHVTGDVEYVIISNTYFSGDLVDPNLPFARSRRYNIGAASDPELKEYGVYAGIGGNETVLDIKGVQSEVEAKVGDTRFTVRTATGTGKQRDPLPPARLTDEGPALVTAPPGPFATEGAVVYTGPNETGASQSFSPGRYDLEQLALGNDVIRSAWVPVGWRMVLWSEKGFWGRSLTLTGDSASPDVSAVAGVSSLVVDRPAAVAFVSKYYQGPHQYFSPGRYDVKDLAVGGGSANDRFLSMRVPPQWTVTVYSEAGFQGRSSVLTADTNDLSAIGGISSVIVEAPAGTSPGPVVTSMTPTSGHPRYDRWVLNAKRLWIIQHVPATVVTLRGENLFVPGETPQVLFGTRTAQARAGTDAMGPLIQLAVPDYAPQEGGGQETVTVTLTTSLGSATAGTFTVEIPEPLGERPEPE